MHVEFQFSCVIYAAKKLLGMHPKEERSIGHLCGTFPSSMSSLKAFSCSSNGMLGLHLDGS